MGPTPSSFPPYPPLSHNYISSPLHPPPFPHPHPPFPTPSRNLEGLQDLPSCLQGPAGQALDSQLQVWSPPPPRIQNSFRFKIIHRLQDADRSHRYRKTLMFKHSNNV